MRGSAQQGLNGVAASLVDDVFQFGRLFADFQNFKLDLRRGSDRWRRALNFSGLALASATKSFIVLAGRSDLTTNVLGEVAGSLAHGIA